MKELDVLMERYYARRYHGAPALERETFVRMLDQVEDPDIWAWVMGYEETPADYADVIGQLRQHH